MITTVKDGDWTDGDTWDQGSPPSDGDQVMIVHQVRVAEDISEVFDFITIKSLLWFSSENISVLRFDTMVVEKEGILEIGTEANPIADSVTLEIHPGGELNNEQSNRGIICHGTCAMYGKRKAPYTLVEGSQIGDERLLGNVSDLYWEVGDTIVVAGTESAADGEDVTTIKGIDNVGIDLEDSLVFDHQLPGNRTVHVINLTRNIVIKSAVPYPLSERGHIMFHSHDVDLNYVSIFDMGRTDKKKKLDNQSNRIGRYPLHFHEIGVVDVKTPAQVNGVAIAHSPGTAITHHSSVVEIYNCVAYDIDGASFFGEAGDEIGIWENNVSIKNQGSNFSLYGFGNNHGHRGHGFWLQGPGIELLYNVASGAAGEAFGIMTRALKGVKFPRENLQDPSIAKKKKFVKVGDVPLFLCSGNIAYGNTQGFRLDMNLRGKKHKKIGHKSYIKELILLNNETGLWTRYNHWAVIEDLICIGEGDVACNVNGSSKDIFYVRAKIEGYDVAFELKKDQQFIPLVEGDFSGDYQIR